MRPSTAQSVALVQDVVAQLGHAAPGDLLAALSLLHQAREELAAWEPLLIAEARERGVSWAELAPALGVASRQAAERRFLRRRPSEGGESTGEERVRAERDRRAAERTVRRWARENSAQLRQLAGQVSAVPDEVPGADQVHRALGEDDPAELIAPLAAVHVHLVRRHSVLAARIRVVTQQVEDLRRDPRRRGDT
ncbi:MAG TPA: HSP18 transcriptional regulator [Pseudonocardiaceae bacterium]